MKSHDGRRIRETKGGRQGRTRIRAETLVEQRQLNKEDIGGRENDVLPRPKSI
jgi:hypothetical protein